MLSEFQRILIALQSDLNGIMLSSVAANQALSGMIGLYSDTEEYSHEVASKYVSKWTIALHSLSDALEAFQNDAGRLEEYLNAER